MRYLVTPQNISLNYNGMTHLIESSDPKYEKIKDAIRTKNFDIIPSIVDGLKNVISLSTNADFRVEHGQVFINNTPINASLATRIIEYVNAGLDPASLVNFWKNLAKNPSSRARERLFLFLENGNHPFTDDGCFIAYKKVRSDMKDGYTGTIDNSVGCKPSMKREEVDDDPEHTCSRGLHVASWSYAQGYSGTILIDVKVNPAHVVSIPTDYNNQKMRVCEYEVIALSKSQPRQELHVFDDNSNMDIDQDNDGFEDDEDDDEDIDDTVDNKSEDFGDYTDIVEKNKGYEDAKALYTYFTTSLNKTYTANEFLALKRFDNKSHDYMAGVKDYIKENFR